MRDHAQGTLLNSVPWGPGFRAGAPVSAEINASYLKPKRLVAIRRNMGDFVVAIQPENVVVFRMRRACAFPIRDTPLSIDDLPAVWPSLSCRLAECYGLWALKGSPHAKSLLVVSYHSISDPQKLAACAKLAPGATAPFGARYLARGNAAAAYEHGLKERIVITEFPSVEKATAAYNSPAYAEALKALGDGAVRDVRIIEGLE